MTSDRKHPSVAFWISVAFVAVLVGYPLSFGPACWITSRTNVGAFAIPFVYRPIMSGLSDDDESGADDAVRSYAKFGAAKGWTWWPRGYGEWEWCDVTPHF